MGKPSKLENAEENLEQASETNRQAEDFKCSQFYDGRCADRCQARRGTTYAQRRLAYKGNDQAADNASKKTGIDRGAGSLGDS